MALPLKTQNSLGLYGLLAANIVLFHGVIQHDAVLSGDWLDVVKHAGQSIPAGLGVAFTGLLNAQLTAEAKARVVFLRWHDPLPGSESFTKHGPADPRVDMVALAAAHGPLPQSPKDQNSLWYKLYKFVSSDPSVTQVHRSFLFSRDYACLSLMAGVVLGTAAFFSGASGATAGWYSAVLLLQFLFARRAARTHGVRFVTTVLALNGAK